MNKVAEGVAPKYSSALILVQISVGRASRDYLEMITSHNESMKLPDLFGRE